MVSVFFFKQKTAYEMRISDWSSDVCSSDLRADLAIGMRVFHEKFGYGAILDIDGNKLEVEFEQAGTKRVLDSFVRLACNRWIDAGCRSFRRIRDAWVTSASHFLPFVRSLSKHRTFSCYP